MEKSSIHRAVERCGGMGKGIRKIWYKNRFRRIAARRGLHPGRRISPPCFFFFRFFFSFYKRALFCFPGSGILRKRWYVRSDNDEDHDQIPEYPSGDGPVLPGSRRRSRSLRRKPEGQPDSRQHDTSAIIGNLSEIWTGTHPALSEYPDDYEEE